MPETSSRNKSGTWPGLALAVLLALPLLPAIFGAGSFEDAYGRADAKFGMPRWQETLLAFTRSVGIGLGALLIALPLGLGSAWVLAKRRGGAWWLGLCALPLALAPSALVTGWLWWCAPGDPSEISSAFRLLPPGQSGPGLLFTVYGAALLLGLTLWPVLALETWPAFQRVLSGSNMYSAARLSGSSTRAFFQIALPLAKGEILSGTLLVFLLAAADFTVCSLLLTRGLPVLINDQLALFRPAAAAWTALPLALLAGAGVWFSLRLPRFTGESGGALAETANASNALKFGSAEVLLLIGVGLGFLFPLLGCARGAFAGGKTGADTYLNALPPLLVSVRLALATAVALMALGAARIVFFPDGPAARSFTTPVCVALFALAAPATFLAASIFMGENFFREHAGVYAPPGVFWLWCAYVLRFAYLPLRMSEEALRGLEPGILESAALLGQSRIQRGYSIALPLAWPYLAAAGALAFVLVLGELPLAERLHPVEAKPASVELFAQQHYGYIERVFALSLLTGLAALLGLVLAGFGLRRLKKTMQTEAS